MSDTIDNSDYDTFQSALDKYISERPRYARFRDRRDSGDMSVDTMLNSAHGKYMTSWRGIPMIKDCFDLIIVQQLLWEVKPQTVIEIGAYKGASALWAADMIKMYGLKSRVLSLDIDLSLLDPVARECPDVTFIQGDSNEIEKSFPEELLKSLPHPWFINEDAHVNVVGVLEHFDKFTEPGDYILVEDTNPIKPSKIGQGLIKEFGYDRLGPIKLDQLKLFMKDRAERYLVDQHYTDFFGYNVTHNTNGYLKRI